MSKNGENNSRKNLKNNSIQNFNIYSHNRNKSSYLLTDTPSTLISAQPNSINSNKNSKNKVQIKNSINNNYSTSNISLRNKNKDQNTTNNNSLQDVNNIKIKLSKLSSQFSANTPKQLANIYNQLCGGGVDPANIVVKKNLKLGLGDFNKNKKLNGSVSHRNNCNNNFVKYVNNDKFNITTSFLNMTQNYSKIILSQSKSFIIDKKNSPNGLIIPPNKSCNNTNMKKSKNKIVNKKMEFNDMNKSSKNLYVNFYSKNINNHNNDMNDIYKNINQNKKIYFMRPMQKRKKSSIDNNDKSIGNGNSNNNTNQSSNRSKKNIFNNNNLNYYLNNNIECPEELHFFYIKILQGGNKVRKKFEND
jgi:hypothetical protein